MSFGENICMGVLLLLADMNKLVCLVLVAPSM